MQKLFDQVSDTAADQIVQKLFMDVILAERERCAKIAELYLGSCSELTASKIADKIRKEP